MDAQFCGELARTGGATASTSQSPRSTINVRVQPTPGVIISLESSTQSLNAASSVLGATLQRRAALDASTVSPLRLGLPYILVRGVVAQRPNDTWPQGLSDGRCDRRLADEAEERAIVLAVEIS